MTSLDRTTATRAHDDVELRPPAQEAPARTASRACPAPTVGVPNAAVPDAEHDARCSPDFFVATDRYRLTMPYADRV